MAKKTSHPLTVCRQCARAELHRRLQNPVVAHCLARNRERFVASSVMRCEFYKERVGEEVIIQDPDLI